MKIYKIKKDGFEVSMVKGKNKAINILNLILAWEGDFKAQWSKWVAGVLKVKTQDHEFTIEEAV